MFEVYPDVQIGPVADLAITRPVAEVTSQDVDRTLEVLRKRRTTYSTVERAAQPGDRVHVDFTGTIDGVRIPRRPGARFSDRARRRTHAA